MWSVHTTVAEFLDGGRQTSVQVVRTKTVQWNQNQWRLPTSIAIIHVSKLG